MATQNPYSDSLLADAFRGSLSNLESLGRGFAVAPVGLLGDVEGLLRKGVNYSFGRGGVNVSETPVLPTTEGLLSRIPRVSAPRMETAGMEQLGAAMNPRGPVDLARGAGRLAGSAVNEAMVYGRGPLAAITPQPMRAVQPSIVREGNPIQSAVVLIGDRIFTGRTHGDALNRAVYEGVVRKEGGKFIFPKGAEVNSDLFMTKDGQVIDRLQASKMFDIGASETAIEKGLMQNKPPSSMSIDSYIEQAKAIKKQREKPSFTYPQEEAMRLAQQRAALPVEQGGLGLAADNTAEQRAAAMGFDLENPQYHATDVDFTSIKPSSRGKMGAGIYSSPDAQYAEKYAPPAEKRTLPLVSKGYYADADKRSQIFDQVRENAYANNPDITSRELHDLVSQEMQNRQYSGFDVDKERLTFNPDDIRSRFAAFDPFRRNAAIAAAMGVAAPNLLAQEQPQSAGLLYPLP